MDREFKSIGKNVTIYEPVAIITPENLEIEDGVVISEFAHILAGGKTKIGAYSHIGPHVSVGGGGSLLIGKGTSLSAGVKIVTGYDNIYESCLIGPGFTQEYRNVRRSFVVIGDYCLIATGTIILPGVVIGDGAIIGAGSLVTKDVEAWTINYGNPCRKIRIRRPKLRDEIFAKYEEFLKGKDGNIGESDRQVDDSKPEDVVESGVVVRDKEDELRGVPPKVSGKKRNGGIVSGVKKGLRSQRPKK